MTYPSDAPPGTGATAGSRSGPGTDEHVLALSLGQPEAFSELYARHFAVVYRYVAGRLGPAVITKDFRTYEIKVLRQD